MGALVWTAREQSPSGRREQSLIEIKSHYQYQFKGQGPNVKKRVGKVAGITKKTSEESGRENTAGG
jgi:hypothetical protein